MVSQKPRLLLLGGSGRTGQLIVDEGLRRGYEITALVRRTSSLTHRPGLTTVEGTPLNKKDIETALRTSDGRPTTAICALGQTRKSGNPWAAPTSPPKMVADSVSNLVVVAKPHNIVKIVVITMFGTGDSFANLNFLMRGIMKYSNMVQTLEDHNSVNDILKNAEIPIVQVRPAMLKGDQKLPVIVHQDNGGGAGFMPSISANSVANFVLDAVEQESWNGRTPVISN